MILPAEIIWSGKEAILGQNSFKWLLFEMNEKSMMCHVQRQLYSQVLYK